MAIEIETQFSFALEGVGDVLLQFEAAAIPEQEILETSTTMSEADHVARIAAHDGIGERIWLRATGPIEVRYAARVEPRRITADLATLGGLDPHLLPADTVQYLFDSRYCPGAPFQPFVEAEFGGLQGGARIAAIRDWVAERFRYEPGSSDTHTTALDSFVERRGICRDYAHVVISLARASAIPARYVSAYAPGVEPPDFHAVAEVFLRDPTIAGGGSWQIVDATGMADPAETAKIGVGRDAADVSFMTSFGEARFGEKTVSVRANG
ncbi:transglutaminase-like domain-containing protein [Altererythrobacter sp. B11]|uniref:transglutaminase-like domain-containing protein n=1 Tax=Altererythrobacter sp. B11 TaxID=2060312 RepID=UPI000E5AD289|nr:transglutaminase family protein [Altererythrobacter sp. B11]